MHVIVGLLAIGLYILCKEIADWSDRRMTPKERAAAAWRAAKYGETPPCDREEHMEDHDE